MIEQKINEMKGGVFMAFQSHRTNFIGDLSGIKQSEIVKLDYSEEKLKERLAYINKKYAKTSTYFEEYTSNYYKSNLNTNDNLSCDINIFRAIERDGTYLLNSFDVERDRQYKYYLLTQEEFDKKIKEEQKIDIRNEELVDKSAYILNPNFKNTYTNMDLTLTRKDIEEKSEMGEILRDYEAIRQHLRNELKNIKDKNNSYLNVSKIRKALGTIKCDMLDVKKCYKGITRPSTKLGDIGSLPSFDHIDYTNPNHIKAIISNVRFGDLEPDSMLSHISYDIKNAINKLYINKKLDSLDIEIIDCKNSGYTERRIAQELHKGKTTIQQRLRKIYRRIALYFKYVEKEN